MKLTVGLILILNFQTIANVYSQNRVTLNYRSTDLKTVLYEIEKQTSYRFIFSNRKLTSDKTVNIAVKDADVTKVLELILSPHGFTFSMLANNLVVIIPAGKNIVIKLITGKVLDEKDEPLADANIKIKGGSGAVFSNKKGEFSIEAPDDAILVVSYIGYETREVQLSGNTNLTVQLKPSVTSFNEVVVIGYGTQKKSDITGSVARADLESFRQAPNANLVQMLQGSVPGLNVGQVNSSGQNPSIQVRGQSTLSGNTNVLIILDGIVFNGSMASINPGDIASVDVLKDASSKAIYGSAAANGVLLLTSKKGKNTGKPLVNYTTSYATQNPANRLHALNREQFIQKIKDINWQQAYLGPDYLQPNPAFNVRTKIDGTQQTAYDDGATDFNWYDATTHPGYLMDHELSISNATEKTNFFISAGYAKQRGLIINDDFSRKSARINFETKLLDWLTFGAQTYGSFMDYSGTAPALRDLMLYSPLNTPYDANGNLVPLPNGSITNPLTAFDASDYDHRNALSGNFYALVNIPYVKGLSYRMNFGNNYYWNQRYTSNKWGANNTGAASKSNDANYDYTIDNIINYKKTIADAHNIDLTLVYGARKNKYEYTNGNGTNFSNISLGYNSLETAVTQRISSDAYQEQYNYQTARLNYNFNSRYLLTATIRRDGFSGFAENNKEGIFPSVAVGWVISKEPFFKANAINNLKLRASYGSNGNLTSRYASLARLTQSTYIFGDGNSNTLFGQNVNSLANPNLKWETTTGINLGADVMLLDDRISVAVDYYNTNTNDLLYNVNIPTITGFNSISTNIGKINNKGIEININSTNIRTPDIQWETAINFSRNTNRILKLLGTDGNNDGKEDDLISSNLFIGRSIQAINNYVTDGLWQIGETPPSGYFVGGEKLVDVDKNGVINADDRVISGYREPAYRFSISNTFSWKQFSLFVFINSMQGGKKGFLGVNDPWTDLGIQASDNALRNNWFKEVDYWTPSNPNAEYRLTGQIPAIDPEVFKSRNFVRLQDVSLSYNFSNAVAQKLHIKNLRLYLSGKNLHTWTKWKGWDPETGQGLIYGGMPVIKAYAAGINFTF